MLLLFIKPKAIEKNRKTIGLDLPKRFKLRCKVCVAQAEAAERKAAAERSLTAIEHLPKLEPSGSSEVASVEILTYACAGKCGRTDLPASAFNRNQLSKGPGKARCRECVEKSIEEEKNDVAVKHVSDIADAREALKGAEASGDAIRILKASNHLSALEAQHVTGIQPKVLGRSGRYRSGRTSGRGCSRGPL